MEVVRLYKTVAELLFPPDLQVGTAVDRSQYERFALPYTFKPRISLYEASLAVTAALTRIVLGSVLFAFCGTAIWMTWASVSNPILRFAAVLPMVLTFGILMVLLMAVISLLLRRLLSFRQL